jgi:hypothetical protein
MPLDVMDAASMATFALRSLEGKETRKATIRYVIFRHGCGRAASKKLAQNERRSGK